MKQAIRFLLASSFSLPGLVFVLPAQAYTVTPADLELAANAHVQSVVPHESSDRISVDILGVPYGKLDFPEAESKEALEIIATSDLTNRFAPRSIVRISIKDPISGQLKTLGLPVKIRVERPVWVAKASIPAQSTLSANDFDVQTRDISQQFDSAIIKNAEAKPLSGYKTRVSIRKGDILDSRQIAVIPDIQRMADIRIVITNQSGMNISINGEALEAGSVGDTIRVRYRGLGASLKPKGYMARVVGKNRVVVEM